MGADPRDPRLPEDAAGILDGRTDLMAELSRWTAEARADDAAASRTRERWLRQQSLEESSLAGLLLDLAERAASVVVHTTTDRRHRGVVAAVGVDFVAVRTRTGRDVLVALDAIAGVRPEDRAQPPSGDREVPLGLRLVEALVTLVGERPRVSITTRGTTEGVTGELRAVGKDVLTLRLDGDPAGRATVYVPIGAIAEVALV